MKTYAIFDDSFFNKKPVWIPEKLYRVVCHRSNPRSREYMLDMLGKKFPDAEVVDTNHTRLPGMVILLYPDSIGLGWKKIEKKLIHQSQAMTVLNGRKRLFDLTSSIRRQLLWRRFLEKTFLPEIIFTPFVFIYGTVVALMDKYRGNQS